MQGNDLLKSEVIGSEIEVIDANNPTLIGLKGKVIHETKNTLTIEINHKKKVILKSHGTFKWKGKILPGKLLVGRPEDRLKK